MYKTARNLVFSIAIISTSTYNGCAAIGKMVADMMTEKTATISNAAVQASYTSNLFSQDTKITGYDTLKQWQEGKSAVL